MRWVLILLIVGSIILIVCLLRHLEYHFTTTQHVGLECGIWYWHFVDGVGIKYVFKCFVNIIPKKEIIFFS